MQFLRDKRSQSIFIGIFTFVQKLVLSLFSGLAEALLPEFILRRIMRSPFYALYRHQIGVQLVDKPLSTLLRSTYMSRKPIMFCVANPNGCHESLLTLLTNPGLVRKIVLP